MVFKFDDLFSFEKLQIYIVRSAYYFLLYMFVEINTDSLSIHSVLVSEEIKEAS